ncbi:MAG TPA: hypothetical protein DHW63_02445 [Hyphomonadaceae bacterium]|nr:hypothetical protein [Hyphomonadaceae bacterium]
MLARTPLNALRAFECLARHRNHTAAAKELSVTVSALSHQMRKLENALGAPLVVTTGKRFALTESGQALALSLTTGFDRVREGLANFGRFRPLRVSVCPLFAGALLAPRWQALEAAMGEELELRLDALPARSLGGEIDAAVCVTTNRLASHRRIDIHTAPAAPVAAAPIRDALHKNGDSVLWLSCTHWNDAILQWRAKAPSAAQPRRSVSAEGLASLHTACLQGAGVAILPVDLIRGDLQSGRLVEAFSGAPHLDVVFALHFPREALELDRMKRLARAIVQTARANLMQAPT